MDIIALDSDTLATMTDCVTAEIIRLGDEVTAADAAIHAAAAVYRASPSKANLKAYIGALRALHEISEENTRAASRIVNAL